MKNPDPLYRATGGPYITIDRAIKIAINRARPAPAGKEPAAPPILRQAAARTTYGDIVTWAKGSRTQRIDLAREVYLVVLSTTYTPKYAKGPPMECKWVGVVVDATDGTPWELHCGPTSWPLTLPPALGSVIP